MKTKTIVLFSFLISITFISYGQIEKDSTNRVKKIQKPIEKKAKTQQLKVPVYKLFPTKNIWTLLKLNTRNGQICQLHFTVSKNGFEGTLSINSYSLVIPEDEVNGRFNLYPTDNMYNFILLDQINGKTYKVQWNNDEDKRFMRRIYD